MSYRVDQTCPFLPNVMLPMISSPAANRCWKGFDLLEVKPVIVMRSGKLYI